MAWKDPGHRGTVHNVERKRVPGGQGIMAERVREMFLLFVNIKFKRKYFYATLSGISRSDVRVDFFVR